MEVGNIGKCTTFKSFLHLSYKNTHTITFFVTVLFNIFMRQTITDDCKFNFYIKGTLTDI